MLAARWIRSAREIGHQGSTCCKVDQVTNDQQFGGTRYRFASEIEFSLQREARSESGTGQSGLSALVWSLSLSGLVWSGLVCPGLVWSGLSVSPSLALSLCLLRSLYMVDYGLSLSLVWSGLVWSGLVWSGLSLSLVWSGLVSFSLSLSLSLSLVVANSGRDSEGYWGMIVQ